MTYVDRQLSCVDCGVEFIHSAADQEFYAQRGFVSEPKRCTSCRASRRQARESGYDVSDIGGPRGYDAGKKITGRKRHVLVDTLGLLLRGIVHPADVQDRDGLAARLNNPAFAERAKPEAVAKAREDHDARAAEAERLSAALARLG